MNISEILKYCPKGTKLYSLVHGEVIFEKVENSGIYPIKVALNNRISTYYTKDGSVFTGSAECVLFPSKEQRDWSKFGVSDQATDQKQKTELKPFDKVLVRDEDDDEWVCDIFSHIDEKDGTYNCIGSYRKQCIAYDGNEHLLGTTNKPE